MRVHFIYSDKRGEQNDYTELNSTRCAKEQLQGLIKKYNRVETSRYGESAALRTFVRIVEIPEDDKGVEHE